ncbi:MAG: hypothetical protein ACR2N3_15870 [Pyrinomonadaceae bacterium]
MDYRKKNPGEFLNLQEAFGILSEIRDYSATQFAAAFLKVGLKARLSQKQWKDVFRTCRDAESKNSLKQLEQALEEVMGKKKPTVLPETSNRKLQNRRLPGNSLA